MIAIIYKSFTLSDNFFYKKIEIAVPNIADLQVPTITAQAKRIFSEERSIRLREIFLHFLSTGNP